MSHAAKPLDMGAFMMKRPRFRLWRSPSTLVFAGPAAFLLLAAFVFPIALVLSISVREPTPGIDNYAQLLNSPALQTIFLRTFRIAAITTILAAAGGYIVAFTMNLATSRKQAVLLACVLIPLWSSVLIRAFAWVTLLRGNGVVNQALMSLDFISAPLPLMRNEFGTIVGMVHVMLPIATLPIFAVMRTIDPRLMLAARSLGAREARAILSVFLPLSLPGLAAAAMLVFVSVLGFYITPAVLGGGSTVMVAEYIEVQISETLRWGLGTMMATVLLASALCMFALGALLPAFRQQYRL